MDLAAQLRQIADAVALAVEVVGIVIVAVGVCIAVVRYVRAALAFDSPFPPDRIQLGVARSLSLALELLLGADILRTTVDPSWEKLGHLAAIAAIRTVLGYFLQREIQLEERRLREQGEPTDADAPKSESRASPS